jgi:hypothetical protein
MFLHTWPLCTLAVLSVCMSIPCFLLEYVQA